MLKNLKLFFGMFWEYHKNNKRLEKFFRLREFQMPKWGKGLFFKWVCENGLLWYAIKQAGEIITRMIIVAEIEERERELVIEELKQRIAALDKQNIAGVVKFPITITYKM